MTALRPNGDLLDRVKDFLARFVAYPSEDASIAHTLWVAHTHLMESWYSTPRIAFLSPEPGSGKSRALEVTELLVPRAIHAVNTTPAYLFRKVSDPDGPPTILYDEIDTVFGPKAKDNEDIRGMLNSGHRRGATAGRCIIRGKTVETEELPSYCAVALAGLGELPDTILNRSVVIRMRRRAPHEKVEPFRRRLEVQRGHDLRGELAAWARRIADHCRDAEPEMPDGIADRDADVWEALLTVADVAGKGSAVAATDWPIRARVAAVALVADLRDHSPSVGLKLLSDLRDVFEDLPHVALPTSSLLTQLKEREEGIWADIGARGLDPRYMAKLLSQYGVKPKVVRIDAKHTPRGYDRRDLEDAWARYLPPLSRKSATSATAQHDDYDSSDRPTTASAAAVAGS